MNTVNRADATDREALPALLVCKYKLFNTQRKYQTDCKMTTVLIIMLHFLLVAIMSSLQAASLPLKTD